MSASPNELFFRYILSSLIAIFLLCICNFIFLHPKIKYVFLAIFAVIKLKEKEKNIFPKFTPLNCNELNITPELVFHPKFIIFKMFKRSSKTMKVITLMLIATVKRSSN